MSLNNPFLPVILLSQPHSWKQTEDKCVGRCWRSKAVPLTGTLILLMFAGAQWLHNAKTRRSAVPFCLIAGAVWPRSIGCASVWVAAWSYIRYENAMLVFNSIMRMTGEHGWLYGPSSGDSRTSSKPESCLMFAHRDSTKWEERVISLHWNVNPPRQTTAQWLMSATRPRIQWAELGFLRSIWSLSNPTVQSSVSTRWTVISELSRKRFIFSATDQHVTIPQKAAQ